MPEKEMSVRDALKKYGAVIHDTKGISMLPLLEEGKDRVCLKALSKDCSEVKINDVVLFERNGSLVLHRVIGMSRNTYMICGDNCTRAEKVRRGQLLAVMTGYYKGTEYHGSDEPQYLDYVASVTSVRPEDRKVLHPMQNEWITLILLLRMAITGGDIPELPADTDWNAVFILARKHSIASVIADAVSECGCPEDVCLQFRNARNLSIKRHIMFTTERSVLFSEFERSGIKYIPLKGVILSDLYPKAGSREYSDNDILLFPDTDRKSVRKIMLDRGYEEQQGSVHNSYHKAPCYNFELHSHLFSDEMDFKSYFEGVFSRAVKTGVCEYRLSDEDFYCHIIGHMFKHYVHGGFGLRTVADLWLLKREYRRRNSGPFTELLKKLGLSEFEQRVSRVSDMVFSDPGSLSYDDISYIMTSGTYGVMSHSVDNGIRKYGKNGFLLRRLFPDFASMRELYPVLKYIPVLLPFLWGWRLFTALFVKDKRFYLRFMLGKVFGRSA